MKKLSKSPTLFALFAAACLAVLVMSLYSRSVIQFLLGEMEANIMGRLMETARRGADFVTAAELAKFQRPEDMGTPEYRALRLELRDFAEEAGVLYVYYFHISGDMAQYIVDNDFDERTRSGLDTPPSNIGAAPDIYRQVTKGGVHAHSLGYYFRGWEGLISGGAPIYDENGKVVAACGVDINDEKIVQARGMAEALWLLQIVTMLVVFVSGLSCFLSYKREARLAKNANLAKSRFLSNFSHEMRTPLSVMSTSAQLVRELIDIADSEEEMKASLDEIRNEAARLARMSDAAVALGVAQSADEEMRELDFGALVRTTVGVYRALIERGGNRLALEIADELPPIFGDADGLSQVLINLISNAGKHTRDGDIRVAVAHDARGISVTVSDTGEGIDPEMLREIFEQRPTRTTNGSVGGIGLSISRAIVERHGGKIRLESEKGVGTSAYFTLPAAGRR